MDFVALLSGGKDSCYNIHQCIANSHRLVCLANLSPPQSVIQDESCNEELNSFMYQSAGSSVIPAYEHCMGVPIIIHEIRGKAVDQSMHYDHTTEQEQDEVEDLFELLKSVMNQFPTIKGVSCGAIVSNYQRLRVENICERLGLTMLSYLWQKDRQSLLSSIIDDGIDAVLVKVAGAGLDPYKHLGKSLKVLHPTLISLHNKYGLDVCGEGGEYESLVLDAPFFKKRIVIVEKKIFLDDEDSSVGNMKIASYRLEDKDPNMLQVPTLKETLSTTLAKDLAILLPKIRIESNELKPTDSVWEQNDTHELADISDLLNISSESSLTFTSLLLPDVHTENTIEAVQNQLRQLMMKLSHTLVEGSTLHDVVFVHLYISDIRWFTAVNEEYCKYFGKHPPSRSCVMASLSEGTFVALDAIYLKNSHQAALKNQSLRQVLHVKGISDWAPLCIGPYAQCNSIYDHTLSLIAGQIPLNPSAMSIRCTPLTNAGTPTTVIQAIEELKSDAILSARHIARILNTQYSNLQCCLTLILYINSSHPWSKLASNNCWSNDLKPLLRTLANSKYSAEEDMQKHIHLQQDSLFADDLLNEEQEQWDEDEDDHVFGNRESYSVGTGPLVVVVGVPGLPRDAALELEAVAMKRNILPSNGLQNVFTRKRIRLVNDSNSSSTNNNLVALLEFVSYPSCFGNGSISIMFDDEQYFSCNTNASEKIGAFISSIILKSMTDTKVKLAKSSLKCIRLFFLPKYLGNLHALQEVFTAILRQAGVCNTGIVCIPCSELEENVVVSCVFQCIDFEQIETRRWIANV